jgi:vacuolar-type H+-ATPase subunit E/Vma4
VAYEDLLRALEEEVREQTRALRETARAERARVLEEARRGAATAREEALSRARAELVAERARGQARAAQEEGLRLLVEQRRLLDALRGEARRRLRETASPDLDLRLLDEALADDGGEEVEIRVDPGREAAVRERLRTGHAAVAARAHVVAAPEARGGVEVCFGGRAVSDNTLPSRLDKAWPALEPELAALLFGGPDGGV